MADTASISEMTQKISQCKLYPSFPIFIPAHLVLIAVTSEVSKNLATINVKLDEILRCINRKTSKQSTQIATDMSWCNFNFPLSTLQNVRKFESELQFAKFNSKMVN